MEGLSSEGFCWNCEGTDAFSGGEGHERDECICMLFRVEVGFARASHEPVAIGCFSAARVELLPKTAGPLVWDELQL